MRSKSLLYVYRLLNGEIEIYSKLSYKLVVPQLQVVQILPSHTTQLIREALTRGGVDLTPVPMFVLVFCIFMITRDSDTLKLNIYENQELLQRHM